MDKSSIHNFVFLDFEASSLDRDSWPIEIGLSWITSELRVETFNSLIRPAPEWSMSAWSPASARIHKIPRKDLDAAPSVESVLHELTALLGDRKVLSDAPIFETLWLERLIAAAKMKTKITVREFQKTTFEMFTRERANTITAKLKLNKVPHRAGADSARLADAWLNH